MIYQTDETRRRILENAERCFGEHGFFETQMKDVAEAVGMSRNTLYRYYRDKFELGFAILEQALKAKFEGLVETLEQLASAENINVREEISNLFTDMYSNDNDSIDDRFIAEFDAFYSGDRIPEDFRERLTNVAGIEFFRLLDVLIKRGQADGSLRNDIDAHIISTTISNAIQAFHQRMILRNSALIELEIGVPGQLTPVLIQILIDGLKPNQS
jgi:AcrR family transcriptional regulator